MASGWYALNQLAVQPEAAYVSTFTRLWEFALASLVALVPQPRVRSAVAPVLGWVGLVAVVVGGLVVGRSAFPGPAALWPLLAASPGPRAGRSGLLAYLRAEEERGNGLERATPSDADSVLVLLAVPATTRWQAASLLGTRPLGWVADRAYGIYLWRWPVRCGGGPMR
ncbi:hypothetical protein HJ590_15435 [Naumannella sp. ID2617S]|nr:hypothetical protein [Naumannella sp. ID2617S]